MKIRLYKPVAIYILRIWGNNKELWEIEISKWAGFKVSLPMYFWEVHLFLMHKKIPRKLTLECHPEKNWYSVFYSYNLNGDLKKYMEITLIKKCKRHKEMKMWKKIRKAG